MPAADGYFSCYFIAPRVVICYHEFEKSISKEYFAHV